MFKHAIDRRKRLGKQKNRMINFLNFTFYFLGRLTLTLFSGSVIYYCSEKIDFQKKNVTQLCETLICHLHFVRVIGNRLFLCRRNNMLVKIQSKLRCVLNHNMIFSRFCNTRRRVFLSEQSKTNLHLMQVNKSWLKNGWPPPDPDQTNCKHVIS